VLKWLAAGVVLLAATVGALFYRQGPTGVEPAPAVSATVHKTVSKPEPKRPAQSEPATETQTRKAEVPKKPEEKKKVSAPVTQKAKPQREEKRAKRPVETTKRPSVAVGAEKIVPSGRTDSVKRESIKPPKTVPARKHSETETHPLKREVPKVAPSAAEKRKVPAGKPVLQIREVQDLDALIRQYEKFPRYATALKIANLYFEKEDYENAALWARKANLIDRDDEEAWVLYAKSEYALGNRDRARRILRLYLDYRDSVKARTLLLSWSRDEDTEEKKQR